MSGRGVLITGAAAGLGLALAEAFASRGDRVFLTDISPEVIPAARRLAAQSGLATSGVVLDLTRADALEELITVSGLAPDGVDILINNAVTRSMASVEDLDHAAWDRALEMNLSLPFRLIKAMLAGMRAKGWGRVINMASVYSLIAQPGRADYVITKHALIGLTRTVALELAGTAITCNAICPGLMATESALSRIAALAAEKGISGPEAEREFLSTRQPGGRFIPMETVTALALFLCGETSAGINGAAIPVNNGWSFA